MDSTFKTEALTENKLTTHAASMDSLYRFQRYIYDFTRPFYLVGRNRLLNELHIKPGDRTLEVGCGTGRNLIYLAKKYPQHEFYGIDISSEMLEFAKAQVRKQRLESRIHLFQSSAETYHYQKTLELDGPFQHIFFSYSLTMIEFWEKTLENTFANLGESGTLSLVDFCDMKLWPEWFQSFIHWSRKGYSVHYRPEVLEYLGTRARKQDNCIFEVSPLLRRFSILLKYQQNGNASI